MTKKEAVKMPSYELFDEGTYVSPKEISKESLARIKSRKIGASILGL